MSFLKRLFNVFRSDRVNDDIEEELRSHLEEAAAQGRDAEEAQRAFGSMLRTREEARDAHILPLADSLKADVVFGVRQLARRKGAATVAVVSLALAVGSCVSAFRLIDALFLRPLPVKNPQSLYVLRYGYIDAQHPDKGADFSYPCFRQLRAAVGEQAELLAISARERLGFSFSSDGSNERAYRQYVSGWMFPDFGMKPALGRLFTERDDLKPGAHPYVVLSYDFWTRRFGQDRSVIGRTLRSGTVGYQIIGVSPKGFTGTETGGFTDLFFTSMANTEGVTNANWNWMQIWVRPKSGAGVEQVRGTMGAALTAFRREQVRSWSFGESKEEVERYVTAPVSLDRASAGVSDMQDQYKTALMILAALVLLVLLIACANVANLSIAQAEARAREMALRVSLGAGRWRLMQLVLVESALIAMAASILGALFSWRAAPLIVGMIRTADDPARLALPADWRTLAFGCGLAILVTLLFGLTPALRASAVRPASALKGGADPHAGRHLIHTLVAVQVAFCFFVYYCTALFVTTFERMAKQPMGFSPARLLALETSTGAKRPSEQWEQVLEHLRSLRGVEAASLCWWPLMSGNGWEQYVWVQGRRSDEANTPYLLKVSPGWIETMKITLRKGRDFQASEAFPQVAIVNELFAKRFFAGQDPIGKTFEITSQNQRVTVRIVGCVEDARYRDLREPIRPTAYVPFRSVIAADGHAEPWDWASFIVRTKSPNPLAMAETLRTEVKKAQPDFQVVNIRTQEEMVESHLVRERLLAALAFFFAGVAVTLAGIGLFGVLNYGVIRRQREFGIRLAVGAALRHIVWEVTGNELWMIVVGTAVGVGAGVYARRFVETLLYQIKETEWQVFEVPLALTVLVAVGAALPPVVRAFRVDPARTLREE